jgi:hypothetical protein
MKFQKFSNEEFLGLKAKSVSRIQEQGVSGQKHWETQQQR